MRWWYRFSRSFTIEPSVRLVLEGEQSDECSVLSGVPKGSVLSPCFYLMYINDMPETIKHSIRLFADDTIMYFTISNQTDCQTLQADLTKLVSWESEWLMAFNPDKCEVIKITKKKRNICLLKVPLFHLIPYLILNIRAYQLLTIRILKFG